MVMGTPSRVLLVANREAWLGGHARNARACREGLRKVGLGGVPPISSLVNSDRLEQVHVELVHLVIPLWRAFDGRNTWLTRRWGWMYLASAWQRGG